MRLGGPVYSSCENPEQWIAVLKNEGYRAAYCPVGPDTTQPVIEDYARAAASADISIAEVGVWCNPLSREHKEQSAAIETCKKQLDLADKIGALCCVNIAGSLGTKWDGPCAEDLTPAAFDMIVAVVRDIIDTVKPKRTAYTLEPMPWMYPDSAHSYSDLIRAIDRKAFAVHFDPVNMINSPSRYFGNGAFIKDFIDKLGHAIRSVHLKDIVLRDNLTVHLDEVRPGLGRLNYATLLTELSRLSPDLPVLLEHLETANEYRAAASFVRKAAAAADVAV